jgi:CheY-like chemotaxis protein
MSALCRKVVVVEDDFLLRLDIALHLEDEGLEVIAAGTADEILAILPQEQPIDLLFTDVQMPGKMNGLALASEVLSRWPDTRVVIASGMEVRPEDVPQRARFVPKPYGPYDVSRIIEELCL